VKPKLFGTSLFHTMFIVYTYLCAVATFLYFNLPKKGINIDVVRDTGNIQLL